ncbi:MAG TPA: hypothetical protein VMC10_19865 [Stellaceae bacterium]|nr:hypothetical protein [Stellaceae bacterium]
MSEAPLVDLRAERARRAGARNANALADYALTQCEEAYRQRDWPRFGYWYRLYLSVRRRMPAGEIAARKGLATEREAVQPGAAAGLASNAREAAMRYGRIGAAVLSLVLATPVPAQTITHSVSTEATVVAATSLSNVSDLPLYMSVAGGTLPTGTVSRVATASGIYYQVSGAAELSIDGRTKALRAGDAIVVPRGARLAVRAADDGRSTYLHFMLSPLAHVDRSEVRDGIGRELFRSAVPIPGLHQGTYVLNLSRVTLPHQAPADVLHHRAAAALHYVLSGVGAENADGVATARASGSISYEPEGTIYQWSNPGNAPLIYLVFNLNPASENAVVADAVPAGR